MPRKSEHLAKARHNDQALLYLAERIDSFPDWVCIAAFYEALHIVEAVLDHDGRGDTATHRSRQTLLKTERRYQKLYYHYRPLRAASEVARYMASEGREFSDFSQYLSPADVRSEIVDYQLQQLKKAADRLMAAGNGKPRKRKY
jgi:hypothetical protein